MNNDVKILKKFKTDAIKKNLLSVDSKFVNALDHAIEALKLKELGDLKKAYKKGYDDSLMEAIKIISAYYSSKCNPCEGCLNEEDRDGGYKDYMCKTCFRRAKDRYVSL